MNSTSLICIYLCVDISLTVTRNERIVLFYRLRKARDDAGSRCSLMRSCENRLRRARDARSVNAARYVAPTSLDIRARILNGGIARDGTRRDERRGEAASRIPRVSRLSLDVNHASSGPTHAYVSLKQSVSRSSRRIPTLRVSITAAASLDEFSRFFSGLSTKAGRVLSVYPTLVVTNSFTRGVDAPF